MVIYTKQDFVSNRSRPSAAGARAGRLGSLPFLHAWRGYERYAWGHDELRLLGGLLASHELTGDPKLLALADDLGGRLLKAFDSPIGLPWMESFLFAETLKYLDLLFAPDSAFDLDTHVLTTEAHPLKAVPPKR